MKRIFWKIFVITTLFAFGRGALATCYTDCSHMVSTAYQQAGCSSPGNTTADMYGRAEDIGDRSSLKPGDILVYRSGGKGHAMMCEDDGCSTIIDARGKNKGIVEGNSDWAFNKNPKVLRASNFCSSC
jgi:hypothetical protein